jgi:hypothetical protein
MRIGNEGDVLACPDPIDAAVLADYWIAALADVEQAAVRAFARCDQCGARLRDIIALTEASAA